MVTYRSAWFASVVLFGTVGIWMSLTSSAGGSVVLFLVVALSAAAVALTLTEQDTRPRWRLALGAGGASGAVVVAVVGLVDLLGMVVGVGLPTLLAVTSPQVLSRALRWSARSGNARSSFVDDLPTAPGRFDAVTTGEGIASGEAAMQSPALESRIMSGPWLVSTPESMDDASLCLAWRKSFVALQRVRSPACRLRILQRRQEILDEFERRNARGFSAWLSSGARAAGDPSKYVFPPQRAGHRDNER